jgi:hypothetical protein
MRGSSFCHDNVASCLCCTLRRLVCCRCSDWRVRRARRTGCATVRLILHFIAFQTHRPGRTLILRDRFSAAGPSMGRRDRTPPGDTILPTLTALAIASGIQTLATNQETLTSAMKCPSHAAGCETCCSPRPGGLTCLVASSSTKISGEPWYNVAKVLDEPCPAGCAACADCSRRERRIASRLVRPSGCDCALHSSVEIDSGGDPCFARASCSCFCSALAQYGHCGPDKEE